MRSRFVLLTLAVYLAFAVLGCSKKSANDATGDNSGAANSAASGQNSAPEAGNQPANAPSEPKEVKREPIRVPAGTAITVSLGSALGSKVSNSGDTFSGTVAKDVRVREEVVIPQGANVSGTVTDAKALGRFKGGAVLQVRLDSITLNGRDLPVHAALRTFSEKGKGKRTAVLAGGGAALGGIIGAIAGGGKGAAIGAAAGGGAGAGGAAFTGNKEIVLPAESALTFELSEPLEIRR
jgi:hypothetical protein